MATTYPTSVISKLLMITDRHLQRLVTEGIIPRAEKGRFELAPAVQGYIRYLRDRAAGHGADGEGDARTEWQKARARRARVLADQMEGRVLDRDDVERAWTTGILTMRSRLLAIPTQLAPQVFAARTQKEVAALLEQGVAEALDELSRVEIEAAEDRPEGQRDPGRRLAGGAEGGEAADEEDSLAVG